MSNNENIKQVFGKLSNYREFAQSQAGIKLFRNGFAVKNFGIDGDDWLKLRDSQTSGDSYYPLRPANVIGYFAIDEGTNNKLKDKTDREGLVSNPYSRNFFTIAYFIRDEINRYQDNIRRSYNDFLKVYKTENNGIKTVTQAFNQLKEAKARTEDVKNEFDESTIVVKNAINETTKIIKSVKGSPMFATDLEKQTAKKVEALLEELQRIQSVLDKLKKVIDKTEKLNEVIDVFYDGNTLPFENNRFDAIFSSEVFEHVFNLEHMLKELNRVLKSGGKMLITCPFAICEHETPNDFARYTSFGLTDLLKRNGFKVLQFNKVGTAFETSSQIFISYFYEGILRRFLGRIPVIRTIAKIIFVPLLNVVSISFNAILPGRNDLYMNNVVLVIKE